MVELAYFLRHPVACWYGCALLWDCYGSSCTNHWRKKGGSSFGDHTGAGIGDALMTPLLQQFTDWRGVAFSMPVFAIPILLMLPVVFWLGNKRKKIKADNGENPDTKKEIIYPIIFDGDKTQSWGMAAIIIGARGAEDKDVLLAHSGVDQGWAGFRATSNLVHLFDFQNDEEPKASEIQDKRGIFYDKGRSIDITSSVSGTFETEGWSVFKFSNLDSNGQPGKNTLWVDTDFPMFRLGDIYLMYAEAVARGGEGSKASAVEYINALRKRAYGDEKHNISENWLEENNFRNLLDERGRELYWEGIRRTDLVRFDLLTSGSYTWDFKGGINTGVGVNKRYNVYPIPVTDLTVNGNLQQNEGY